MRDWLLLAVLALLAVGVIYAALRIHALHEDLRPILNSRLAEALSR